MIVDQNEYEHEKNRFFKITHNCDFTTSTVGSSAEYYAKTYAFEDGAVWYEVNRKTFDEQEVEINIKCIKSTVKRKIITELMEVEYWSSDDADSKKYYELWTI